MQRSRFAASSCSLGLPLLLAMILPALILPAGGLFGPDVAAAQNRAAGQFDGVKAAEGEAGAEKVDEVAQLPPPLEAIKSNIRALEGTGILELEEVNFRPGDSIYGRRDAVVWTLRTRRHITARHLEKLLEQFVDVRFYDTRRGRKALLHRTLLIHPIWLRHGAVNGVILPPGAYVEVWFQLRETDIRRLRSLKADYVELGKRPTLK